MKKEWGMILIASFLLIGCAERSDPEVINELEEVAQVEEEVVGEFKCPTTGFMEKSASPSMPLGFGEKLIVGNHCNYNKGTGALLDDIGYYGNCEDTFEEEFNKHEYSIVNDCLYKGDESVFEKPLSQMLRDDEFVGANEDGTMHVGYYAYEWGRGGNDETVSIYLISSGECGGCAYNGPYLDIDKKTGDIFKGYAKGPYIGLTVFSPERDKFIGPIGAYRDDDLDQNLFIYNLVKHTVSPLDYEVPEDGLIFECGMGFHLTDNVVKWIDNDTVSINTMKFEPGGQRCYKYSEAEPLFDEPVIVNPRN